MNVSPAVFNSRWITDAYCISDDAVVWSRKPKNGRGGLLSDDLKNWRTVRQQKDVDGYYRVGLWIDGVQKTKFVHKLLYECFVGEIPVGYQVCHEDGCPGNNTLGNLRCDTPQGNQRDRLRHGTDSRGERGGGAKLSQQQVTEIRRRLAFESELVIAKEFCVHRSTINCIKHGKTWPAPSARIVSAGEARPSPVLAGCRQTVGDIADFSTAPEVNDLMIAN